MKKLGFLKYFSGMHRYVWITSLGWFVVRCFLFLSLLTLPVAVKAQFTYTTYNGQIEISGYVGAAGAASIPATINGLPVTSIGYPAFRDCTGLTSITIPNSVTSIESAAFYGCTGLKSVNVDANNPAYASVDGVLFNKNGSVLGVYPAGKTGFYTIPNSVTSIGDHAFSYCTGLTSVKIPNSVTSIENGAFSVCTGLTSVTIPNSVTSIGDSAFSGCTGLTSMTIPNSVTSIGGHAFFRCKGLTSVTIGNSVTSIGDWAFYCTGLTSVTIPNSVTSIGIAAFSFCTGLKSVNVDANNPAYASVDGVLFNKNGSVLGVYPAGKTGFYTIPNSVTSIGNYAFSYCTGLTSVTIPNSVTSIENGAFKGCSWLQGVYFLGNPPSLGTDAFVGATAATVYYLPGTTGWNAIFAGRPTKQWGDAPLLSPGAKKWEFQTGGWVSSSPAIGSEGTVYVGSYDNKKVYALNGATGAEKWEFQTGGWVRSSPAIGSEGTVYVGSYDKKVYALNGATGAKKWEFLTGGYV